MIQSTSIIVRYAAWRRPLHSCSGGFRCFSTTGNNRTNGQKKVERGSYSMLKPGFQPTGYNKDGVYLGSTFLMLSPHTLPELDASVLLNESAYAKDIGNSRSGNAAALGFSKAKRDLRELIHQELLGDPQLSFSERKCNNKGTSVRNLYILRGHGVPNQLLQHLVVAADSWLHDKSALELWVDSSCQGSLSVFTTEGASWRTLFPTEWDDDIALYLAAMKRIVSQIGTMTPFCYGQSILPGEFEWKVSISRNNKLPLTLFPNDPEVFPVIEWVVPPPSQQTTKSFNSIDAATSTFSNSYVPYSSVTSSNAPNIGKILIRMQGATNPVFPQGKDYLKQQHDVSLIFEANFEMKD